MRCAVRVRWILTFLVLGTLGELRELPDKVVVDLLGPVVSGALQKLFGRRHN